MEAVSTQKPTRNVNHDLLVRAREVGYGNRIPRIPELNEKLPVDQRRAHLEARMLGYNKRISNWLNGLVTLEEQELEQELPA